MVGGGCWCFRPAAGGRGAAGGEPAAAPAQPPAKRARGAEGLPAGFFDGDAAAAGPPGGLPEGFFDDGAAPAAQVPGPSAAGRPPQPPVAAEAGLGRGEAEEALDVPGEDEVAAADRAKAEEGARAAERADEDAFEQLEHVGRVAVLRQLRSEQQRLPKLPGGGGPLGGRGAGEGATPASPGSSSGSEGSGGVLLDWRSKGF